MDKDFIREKSAFAVAFLAVILALNEFKENLASISIDLGFGEFSLLFLGYGFSSLLLLSAYFFALDFIRYGLPLSLKNLLVFQWIIPLGNFLYALGLLFPFFVLFLWGITWLLGQIAEINSVPLFVDLLTTIIGGVMSLVTGYLSVSFTRHARLQMTFNKKISEEMHLQTALSLLNNQFHTQAVLEIARSLEVTLRRKIAKTGFISEGLPFSELVVVARQKKLINERQAKEMLKVRQLRNQAVHGDKLFTKQQAESALTLAERLHEELESTDDIR